MQDPNAPEALRVFQAQYGRYLRSPDSLELPAGIPERRSEIYEGLLFGNISGFINNCFPVARSVFSAEDWEALIRSFFSEWRCTTPIFSRIPYEFVCFFFESSVLAAHDPWLAELLHYEWIELQVDLAEATENGSDSNEADDELVERKKTVSTSGTKKNTVRINPTAELLSYDWPVHTISKVNQPDEPKPTFLAVYRSNDLKVRFVELNATTFLLLQYLQQHPGAVDEVILQFCQSMKHPNPESLFDFAQQIIAEFKEQEVVYEE